MLTFLWRRLVQLVIVLFVISSLLFVMLRLSGDPVLMLVGESATPEIIAQTRQAMGLDDPLPVQYVRFLSSAATLQFGNSITARQAALPLVLERLPYTAQLAFASLFLALLIGIPLGIFAGAYDGSPAAALVQALASLGQSIPAFWLGILLILLFAVRLRWLPSYGTGGLTHLILPATTLSAFSLSKITLLIRSGILEVLSQDYMRTARAKGLSFPALLRRHALPNVLIPVISVVGMDLGLLMGGAVITETIFAWPGAGRQLIQAVGSRDYPLVQATVFVTALLIVLINMLVDLFYRLFDPRVKVA